MASEKHIFRKMDNHWFKGYQKHNKDTVTSVIYENGRVIVKDLGFETVIEGVDELYVTIKQLDSVNKAVSFKAVSLAGTEKKIPGKLHGVYGDTLLLEYDEEYIPEKKSKGGKPGKAGKKGFSGCGKKLVVDLD